MSVITLESVEKFVNAIKVPELTVVHFSTDWADQCSAVTEVLKELSKLHEIQAANVKFYVCDAENLSEISLHNKVDSVPTVILFRNNEQVDRIDGADAAQITSKVKSHSLEKFIEHISSPPKQNLEERLKSLINRHKIMVFMKGSKDSPRCGFSKTLMEILKSKGVQFDTFDILTDEEVRQGLKTYSNWPTYPQVYVKGELIGGLDIVKDLESNGELDSALELK